MCGRFSLFHNSEEIRRRFRLRRLAREWMGRYNIAPSQMILTVCRSGAENVDEAAEWGLLPRWAKAGAKGMINARAKSIEAKPAFRDAFRNRRCLIVADGFYEWQRQLRAKQPYYITLKDGGLFAFAGVYDDWKDRRTAAILTTEPNQLMRGIHDRMPAILDPDGEDAWLDPGTDAGTLKEAIRRCLMVELSAAQISKRVNDPGNEGPGLIAPTDARQQTLEP